MTYSKERLEEALRVFREAKSARAPRRAPTSKSERCLRTLPATPRKRVSLWRDNDHSDDDDYEPNNSKKRKLHDSSHKAKKAKRKAEDIEDSNRRNKKVKTEKQKCNISFISLTLRSKDVENPLKTFETGRRDSVAPASARLGHRGLLWSALEPWELEMQSQEAAMTYFMKLDQQSLQIDNDDGRVLRSRKILDEKCSAPAKSKRKNKKNNKEIHKASDAEPRLERNRSKSRENCRNYDFTPVPVVLDGPLGTTKNNPIQIASSPSPGADQAQIFTITTKWAHPIEFKWIPKTGKPPCSFDNNFRYGIVGLPELSVKVIQYPGSEQYEELGNGHRAKGKEPTRMCVTCALNRLQISHCKVHHVEQIPNSSEKDLDFKKYLDQMCKIGGPVQTQSIHPVCTVCPGPAFFRCAAPQKFDRFGRQQSEGEGNSGCGMLLCYGCAEMLRQNGGRLCRRELRRIQGQTNRPLRADVEFLFPGSMLHKAYGRSECAIFKDCFADVE